jgi:hypothetical protein
LFAYNPAMGEMKRAIAREGQDRAEYEAKIKDRFASTLVIAASIIAAVRLAREERVGSPSPRVMSAIGDSVSLARMILERVIRRLQAGEKWTGMTTARQKNRPYSGITN